MRILHVPTLDQTQRLFSGLMGVASILVTLGGLGLLLTHGNQAAQHFIQFGAPALVGFGIISIGIWLLAIIQLMRLGLIIIILMQTKDWLLIFLACIILIVIALSFTIHRYF